MAGSVAAAVVASFCCILPIVFGLTGLSILGASALFAAWRPFLLIVTFGLLGLGFYFAYRPRREQCAPGSACVVPSTRLSDRLILWLATAAVLLFAAFPYYSGQVADLQLSHIPAARTPQPAAQVVHATLEIEGMDCAACATAVENKLKAIAGVRKAAVSYEHKRAEVEYDPRLATLSQVERAIQDAGYRARKV